MRKVVIAALASLCAAGLAMFGGGTAHAAASGCTGTFQVGPVTFDRPAADGAFRATATVRNCTGQTQILGGYWLARSVMRAGDPYLPCTDPYPFPMNSAPIEPGGTYTTTAYYPLSDGCPASAIHVSAAVSGSPDVTHSADIPVGAGTGGCTGPFQTSAITYDRRSVRPGGRFTATVILWNCTDQTRTPTGNWFAEGFPPSSPPPCIADDPVPMSAPPIAPGGTYAATVTLDVSSSCAAEVITVGAVVDGSPNSQRSLIDIRTAPPSPSCAVGYHIDGEWSTGFVARVTITNQGAAAVNGWSLSFRFGGDQRVTGSWGAAVQQTGAVVTAVHAPWTAAIAPGGSVSFGIRGTWQRSDAPPADVILNASPCQVS